MKYARKCLWMALPWALAASVNAQDAMFVDSSGNVGVGTNTPDTTFHVSRADGTAQVLVRDTFGTSPLAMFELDNSGFPSFRFTDASASNSWDFRLAGVGSGERFEVTKVGTGGSEFRVFGNGDAELPRGTLAEGSSRSIKDNIVQVDESAVLAKLAALPVSEWSYEGRLTKRHMGPMAEDFHVLFGLGPDDKHIAPKDLAGVALAAAKALKAENDALKADNAAIRDRLQLLESRLEVLLRSMDD